MSRHIDWMDIKYGKDIQPIQFTLTMQQQEASSVGMFKDASEQQITYKYIKQSNGML